MTKENIGYAMQRANVQVFFFDEKQILNGDEEGTFNNFRESAHKLSIVVKERFLNGYYRIVGGESYHNWIEKLIAGDKFDFPDSTWTNLYDLQIKQSFDSFITTLKKKDLGNRVAIIASFTESPGDLRNLQSKNNLRVDSLCILDFNITRIMQVRYFGSWIPKMTMFHFWVNGNSNKLEKCASIYGCQGFEAEYIGLMCGRNFIIRSGK